MNKYWLWALLLFLAPLPGVRAQNAASQSFETIVRCGDIAVVRTADEYRLVVGRRPEAPKLSLLLGDTAAQASARMGRIRSLGAEDTYVQDGRAVVFCGEMFSLSMGRSRNGRTYSFRGLSGGIRFTLSERDVRFIQDAIAERD